MTLTELRELEKAATSGPWDTRTQLVGADRALIKAARNALPALLDVAEAAQEYVTWWEKNPATGPSTEKLQAALAKLA